MLRDGSTLRLRVPTAADEATLIDFFQALSTDSRYLRFHGATSIDHATVAGALETDWQARASLLGELAAPGGVVRPVALATYVRLHDPRRAEVAFAVADDLHGRGVGTRLLERLAAHASESGIEEFVAEVLPQNHAMLGVFDDAGFETTRTLQGGVVEVTLRLASHGSTVAERRDLRDHVAVAALCARSSAALGCRHRRVRAARHDRRRALPERARRRLRGCGLPGQPRRRARWRRRRLHVVRRASDHRRPGRHLRAGRLRARRRREALETGVRALCVISAGFAETGSDGEARQDELLALVRAHGARLVGPNCLGIASSAVRLNATFARRALPAGRVAFSSQSGALGLALLEEADGRGLGLSSFLSIGNKADVSSNDLLEYWEEDEATDLILLYLESFGNPRKFARVAGRVARSKPILAMRSGTSRAGARAASSHTAALASSDAAVDALFWQAGVLRLRTLEELLDAAVLFSTQPLPRGDRVAVLTNAGGLGILCADACEAAGLTLPPLADETVRALQQVIPREASVSNPVDILGSATAATYEATLPL